MAAGPHYMASAWTAQKTLLPTVTPLLRVTHLLPINGCFSGSAVLVLSKYATVLILSRLLVSAMYFIV
jgi:hypothetical protein